MGLKGRVGLRGLMVMELRRAGEGEWWFLSDRGGS